MCVFSIFRTTILHQKWPQCLRELGAIFLRYLYIYHSAGHTWITLHYFGFKDDSPQYTKLRATLRLHNKLGIKGNGTCKIFGDMQDNIGSHGVACRQMPWPGGICPLFFTWHSALASTCYWAPKRSICNFSVHHPSHSNHSCVCPIPPFKHRLEDRKKKCFR